MATAGETKRKLSLSSWILISMAAGIACGIFFGEYCHFLQIFGNAFIKLLQITILPYIFVSLIQGLGGLTFVQARQLAIKAGILLLVFWAIVFAVILLMPLSFPQWVSAAFFSSALVEIPPPVDFLQLYIPSNPFASLANNMVPAVVLFSILIGVALIGVENKGNLISVLRVAADTLIRVTNMIVKLTPLGVFAIAASAAGTMTIEEFGRLQVYLVSFNVAVLLLTFYVLPMMLGPLTPFKYKDVVLLSRDALVTAFTTGNLFVVLTVLTENCKSLFEKYDLRREKTDAYIDVIIPVSFNFPNMGKLIMLLFVLFATWFTGGSMQLKDYGTFVFAGLLSFFGGVDMALPFMLDLMRLPTDMYQLYMVTGIINGRSATLLAAMNLIVFTLLATASLTGVMTVNKKKVLVYVATSLLITGGFIGATRAYLGFAVTNQYEKDKLLAGMQTLVGATARVVHREMPDDPPPTDDRNVLERVSQTGVLRVGYHPDNLPFSFFNINDQLVGFDVDMALLIGSNLGVRVEFYPIAFKTIAEALENHRVDIVMAGVHMTTDRLRQMTFSRTYLDATTAFVVRDHQREKFTNPKEIRAIKKLKIGIPRTMDIAEADFRRYLPNAAIETIESPRDFFSNLRPDLDAIVLTAEAGSAWTLIYPNYEVVVPKPDIIKSPLAYPVAGGDTAMADFVSRWIELVHKQRLDFQRIYDHWILGAEAEERKPRWSVIRNVLGWVE
ncbi:MAG: cation:dicarboxylase symporter family transporter [Desulfobacterales bacterium]|nr:cation:dicarboxylase symporter family transporter [Desulfobacterales bacterium]